MGAATPRGLLNAVFSLNGKNFCLRGGEGHRNLKLSQLQRLSQPDRWIYHENCSKNEHVQCVLNIKMHSVRVWNITH